MSEKKISNADLLQVIREFYIDKIKEYFESCFRSSVPTLTRGVSGYVPATLASNELYYSTAGGGPIYSPPNSSVYSPPNSSAGATRYYATVDRGTTYITRDRVDWMRKWLLEATRRGYTIDEILSDVPTFELTKEESESLLVFADFFEEKGSTFLSKFFKDLVSNANKHKK
jgi:hypothetical protein